MNKLLPLTGIRAIAALWVVLFHLNQYLFDFGWFNPVISKGYLGVDLFFMLSGFILSYVHQVDFKSLNIRLYARFLALRCARMLPVHYFVLGILFLSVIAKMAVQQSSFKTASGALGGRWDLLQHLLNIQGWGLANHTSWNVPAWSISAEWFAYLLFPVIAYQLGKFSRKTHFVILILVCFAGLSFFSIFNGLVTLDWTFRYALIRIAGEFMIGCGLSNLLRLIPTPPIKPSIFTSTAVFFLVAGFFVSAPDILSVSWLAIILWGVAYGQSLWADFLSLRLMVFLGEISYSVYMIYALCALGLNSLIFHFDLMAFCPTPLLFFAMLLILIGVGYLLYRGVEMPARKFIRSALIERYLPVQPNPPPPQQRPTRPSFPSWQPFQQANLMRIKKISNPVNKMI